MSMADNFAISSDTVGSLFDLKSPRYGIISMCYPISDEIHSNKFAYIKLKSATGIAKYASDKRALREYGMMSKK